MSIDDEINTARVRAAVLFFHEGRTMRGALEGAGFQLSDDDDFHARYVVYGTDPKVVRLFSYRQCRRWLLGFGMTESWQDVEGAEEIARQNFLQWARRRRGLEPRADDPPPDPLAERRPRG